MSMIDADALSRMLRDDYHGAISDSEIKVYQILRLLDEAPTVNTESVRHERWARNRNWTGLTVFYTCTGCGRAIDQYAVTHAPYCHCGAKMDGAAHD